MDFFRKNFYEKKEAKEITPPLAKGNTTMECSFSQNKDFVLSLFFEKINLIKDDKEKVSYEVATDDNGIFMIELMPGEYNIVFNNREAGKVRIENGINYPVYSLIVILSFASVILLITSPLDRVKPFDKI